MIRIIKIIATIKMMKTIKGSRKGGGGDKIPVQNKVRQSGTSGFNEN